MNRVAGITSSPLKLTYNYDLAGNVSKITDSTSVTPKEYNFDYDKTNQLVSAQANTPNGIQSVQYAYDGAGNRTKEVWSDSRGTITYGYTEGNYLASRNDAVASQFYWGPYGALEWKDEGSSYTNPVYDTRRLLSRLSKDGVNVARFYYDAFGRRIMATEGTTTTITLTSGNDVVYELKTPSSGITTKTRYLPVNGRYLAKVTKQGTDPEYKYFYHNDLVGSTRTITDIWAQPVAQYDYEPLGIPFQKSGWMTNDTHKFTGKPQDSSTGLYYYNARYMDPKIGRFISRDPAEDGLNWYVYTFNNPLIYIDSTGLDAGFAGRDGKDPYWDTHPDELAVLGLSIEGELGGNATEVRDLEITSIIFGGSVIKSTGSYIYKALSILLNPVKEFYEKMVRTGNLVNVGSKTDALRSVGNLPESIQQGVKSFFKGASNKYSEFVVDKISSGNYIVKMTKPGDVPGSKAIYYKEVAPNGTTIRVWKETFDPLGKLIHTKMK